MSEMSMKIYAPTSRSVQYNGTHGNLSVAVLSVTLAAAAIGDVIYLGEFDKKIEVVDYRLDHANLGAATTLGLGFGYSDGAITDEPTKIAAALSTSSAASKRQATAPVSATAGSHVTATVGGGNATGLFTLTLFYRNVS